MPVALPGPAVPVSRLLPVLLTTGFTDENPRAFLLKLHPVEGGFLPTAGITSLCFHTYSQVQRRGNSFKKSEEI
jgi:hypothetical protein